MPASQTECSGSFAGTIPMSAGLQKILTRPTQVNSTFRTTLLSARVSAPTPATPGQASTGLEPIGGSIMDLRKVHGLKTSPTRFTTLISIKINSRPQVGPHSLTDYGTTVSHTTTRLCLD